MSSSASETAAKTLDNANKIRENEKAFKVNRNRLDVVENGGLLNERKLDQHKASMEKLQKDIKELR